jgi:hypothetical protein
MSSLAQVIIDIPRTADPVAAVLRLRRPLTRLDTSRRPILNGRIRSPAGATSGVATERSGVADW